MKVKTWFLNIVNRFLVWIGIRKVKKVDIVKPEIMSSKPKRIGISGHHVPIKPKRVIKRGKVQIYRMEE